MAQGGTRPGPLSGSEMGRVTGEVRRLTDELAQARAQHEAAVGQLDRLRSRIHGGGDRALTASLVLELDTCYNAEARSRRELSRLIADAATIMSGGAV